MARTIATLIRTIRRADTDTAAALVKQWRVLRTCRKKTMDRCNYGECEPLRRLRAITGGLPNFEDDDVKILVGCEQSGIVRDAFTAVGHDAYSCDMLPSERPGKHIQGNVLDILNDGWDLAIFHPPCQYLSNVGSSWLYRQPGRFELRAQAFDFFMKLVNAPIPMIAVENPVGYPNKAYRKPDQIIHPYYFGDRDMKKTCLWLKGLPKLWYWMERDLFGQRTATDTPEPLQVCKDGRKLYFTDAQPSGKNQAARRSATFPGIAKAMAAQWGNLEAKRETA